MIERLGMRIVILAHNLRAAGGLSVGRNVMASLSRVASEHEYLILMPPGVGYEETEKPARAQCLYLKRRGGWPGQWFFERYKLAQLLRHFRPDVVWGLGNFGLPHPPCKQAVLVHKPHYIYGSESQARELRRYRWMNAVGRRRLARSLPGTQLVFCQTQTACERFKQAFSYSGRTAVMPNAVSRAAMQNASRSMPEVFNRLADRFVLFCLTKYYAHKNVEALAEVFERFADDLRDVTVIFTIEPDDHPLAGRFLARIRCGQLPRHLINVGRIAQTDLPSYYANSQGLILPTLLESFSGTYVEAMQFERPILTSDLDFARDVCGPAARYFDPLDPRSILDAILELKSSPTLRDTLVTAGRERMRTFFRDWDSIVADAVKELVGLVSA